MEFVKTKTEEELADAFFAREKAKQSKEDYDYLIDAMATHNVGSCELDFQEVFEENGCAMPFWFTSETRTAEEVEYDKQCDVFMNKFFDVIYDRAKVLAAR